MAAASRIAVLIVAGGSGTRFGGPIPKQYQPILGACSLRRAIDAFRAAWPDAVIQAVIGEGHDGWYADAVTGLDLPLPVTGGATRQDSVRRGLDALSGIGPDLVAIHDAARPFPAADMLHRVVAAFQDPAVIGAAPALTLSDSVKRESPRGVEDVDRTGLKTVQTPQMFRYDAIRNAHGEADPAMAFTDDLAIAERAGLKTVLVEGDTRNFKITDSADLKRAENQLLQALGDVRGGTGYDVHAFAPGDHVMLCGVRVPHTMGLAGHSDADVGLHALTDAVLGAIGAADIGAHFPPSDARWRGASSDRFLKHAAELVAARGGVIAHVDVTLICEAPKVGPHRPAMIERLATILGIDIGRASVKATTTEGLGFTGRREGIAAMASATVRLPS